jgi:hypothetical protein
MPGLVASPPARHLYDRQVPDERIAPLPAKEVRDHFRAVVDAAIATIPVGGGALQILFDEVLQPNFDKRRDEWLRRLAEVLEEIRTRMEGFDPASLESNEQFVSAVSQATRIAMGTHRQEKLEMLKDSLVNLVIRGAGSDLIVARFLRFIDELEPEHFLVLRYLSSPEKWYADKGIPKGSHYMGAPRVIMDGASLPIVGAHRDLVLRDLESNGLARTGSMGTMMTEQGMWQSMTTDLGEQLLAFVLKA